MSVFTIIALLVTQIGCQNVDDAVGLVTSDIPANIAGIPTNIADIPTNIANSPNGLGLTISDCFFSDFP